MRSTAVKLSASHGLLALLVAAAGLASAPSQAQQVYRIVGPDGKVTFSDQPPPAASNAKVSTANSGAAGASAAANLPFELRQVASKYPVTLYTGENCVPCGTARAMLASRGVPFAEKTITTPEDSQALKRLSGDSSIPFLTIGSQQLKGFSDAEWTQFLNAAGYPASSILPASYRQPAPTPLVSIATPPAAAAAGNGTAPARQATLPTAPQPSADNPAGIRF